LSYGIARTPGQTPLRQSSRLGITAEGRTKPMPRLYERSVAELMIEAAAALTYPASRADVVAWFGEHYSDVKASTVRAHIVGLTANDRSRHHYAWLAKRDPLFVRNESGTLTAFEGVDGTGLDDGQSGDEDEAPPLEFALEAFLEEFLLTNWEGIDWGRPLELWESENAEIGHQLATPVGRLDFLCRDTATGALVVIELKRGRPSDRVVGQTARYMGWVRAELADPGQRVEGLIVAHEQDPQLYYAVSAVPDLAILTYSIEFTLSIPDRPA
jgi:Endonuclease NucS